MPVRQKQRGTGNCIGTGNPSHAGAGLHIGTVNWTVRQGQACILALAIGLALGTETGTCNFKSSQDPYANFMIDV